ncbi:MAG: zinc ribbon domain-containing protein [bacterium]
MPLHEFHCQECGMDFESLVRENESVQKCPKCGSPKVEKKMSFFENLFQRGKKSFDQCSPFS